MCAPIGSPMRFGNSFLFEGTRQSDCFGTKRVHFLRLMLALIRGFFTACETLATHTASPFTARLPNG